MEQQLVSGEKELPKNSIFLNLNQKKQLGGNGMKKIWKNLMAALLVLPLLISVFGVATVNADDTETVDVTVNKRVWKDERPDNIQNTGEEMDFGGEPLEGAGFTVYDVTVAYHNLVAGSTQEAAKETIENDVATYATTVAAVEAPTNDLGQVVFSLPLKKGGLDAVYLIVETRTPNAPIITERAAPIVLAMPIYSVLSNENGQITYSDELNTNIQIYPKNVKSENEKVLANADQFTKVTIDGVEYPHVTTGDILDYQLTINLPASLNETHPTGEYVVTQFVIKDTPGAGLALADPDELTVAGLTEGTDYSVDRADGGFAISLILNDTVRELAGTQLTIPYKMKLTAELDVNEINHSNASEELTNDPNENIVKVPVTQPPGITTGGKQFINVDSHTKDALDGAVFNVKRKLDDGTFEYAIFEDDKNARGEYVFVGWTSVQADATDVVSANGGSIKVIGLIAGEYLLEETQVPSNKYVKLAEDYQFVVTYGNYGTQEDLATVNHVPKGLLPSTGGNGIYAFLAVGALLMIGSYIWFKKSKVQAEV